MKRENIIKILEDLGYSRDSIKSLMSGRMKPNPERRYHLERLHGIPFDIWGEGIKTYLQEHDNNSPRQSSTTKPQKQVSA